MSSYALNTAGVAAGAAGAAGVAAAGVAAATLARSCERERAIEAREPRWRYVLGAAARCASIRNGDVITLISPLGLCFLRASAAEDAASRTASAVTTSSVT